MEQEVDKGVRMAIQCIQCRTELLPTANFCHVCGIQITANVSEPVWEYCEIGYELVGLLGFGHRFIANAIGPRGPFVATAPSVTISTNFPHPGVKKDVQACDAVKGRLIADRWEPIAEHGPEWFNYKFRRRVL